MKNLFVVVLTYVVDIDEIATHRPAHLEFLDQHYKAGVFVVSGRQVPLQGGLIIARNKTRSELEELFKDDPFYQHQLARYDIYEFTPNRFAEGLEATLV